MDSGIKAVDPNSIQAVTASLAQTTKPSVTTSTSDFEGFLRAALKPDQAKEVSEEALFASLCEQRVGALKGDEAAAKYHELLMKYQDQMRAPNGNVPMEDAARKALMEMVSSGELTVEEGDKVHSEAFAGAQLDANLNSLYDGYGGPGDATKAVMGTEEAMAKAKAQIDAIAEGTVTPEVRALSAAFGAGGKPLVNPYERFVSSLAGATTTTPTTGVTSLGTETPNGTTFDGAEGFLFKPISSNNGKLAIMLPPEISLAADAVILKDSSGREIESGYFWAPGFGAETPPGQIPRKKFSFSKPGSAYPRDLIVEVRFINGTSKTYSIPDPSKRYD